MARIVELCGSPGVGKSSIFEVIEQKNTKGDNWTCVTDLFPYGREDWLHFVYRILKELTKGRRNVFSNPGFRESFGDFYVRILRSIRKGKDYIEEDALKQAGDRFVVQYPILVDALWGNIYYRQKESYNSLDLRFEKAGYMYRIIKKLQLAGENTSGKTIIIDEGLINLIDRALFRSSSQEEEREEIKDLLENMPLPEAIVYIETDLEENIKRLTSRKVLRDMHRALSKEDLAEATKNCRERLDFTIQCIEDRGIPVLRVNGLNPIRDNAEIILKFIENLGRRNTASLDQKINRKKAASTVFPRYFGY